MAKDFLDEIREIQEATAKHHEDVREYALDVGSRVYNHIREEIQAKYDARIYLGYVLYLLLEHYPDDMEFYMSAEKRARSLLFEKEHKDYKMGLRQENHEDGAVTIRLFTEKVEDDNES